MNRNSLIYKILKEIEKPKDNRFFEFLNTILCIALSVYGSCLWKKIKNKYPNRKILLLSTCCAGDILFFAYGINSIINMIGINDYIIIADEKSCGRSLKSLGFSECYLLDRLKLKAVTLFRRSNLQNDEIIDCYPWVFFDYSKIKIYGFINKSVISNIDDEKIVKYIERGVIHNKTVILCPYENSITSLKLLVLPELFWIKLAERLIGLGFIVFTNCSDSGDEKAIPGTKSIYPLLTEARDIISYAGLSVMVRSGFCDYIIESEAYKIVLYPDDDYLSKWSLYNFGNIKNCCEIVYGNYCHKYENLIDDIVDLVLRR